MNIYAAGDESGYEPVAVDAVLNDSHGGRLGKFQ